MLTVNFHPPECPRQNVGGVARECLEHTITREEDQG